LISSTFPHFLIRLWQSSKKKKEAKSKKKEKSLPSY